MLNLQQIRIMRQTVISLKLEILHPELAPQHLHRLAAPIILDERIGIAMADKPGGRLVDVALLLGQPLHLVAQEEVGGQGEDAAEPVGGGEGGEDGDGAALGEAAEDDAVGGDGGGGEFLGEEVVEVVAGAEDAGFVVGGGEVVEGGLLGGGG